MSLNKDALRDAPDLDAFAPQTPPRTTPPPKRSRPLLKQLTFAKDRVEGAMADFPSERKPGAELPWLGLALLGGAAILVAVGMLSYQRWARAAATPQPAQLILNSQPAGGEVVVDGERRGVTPLTLSMRPGTHVVQLTREGVIRTLSVTLKPGAESTHYIDLGSHEAPPELGQLIVTSDPPGARVTVDGQPRGVTPVTIADVAAGQHAVGLLGDSGAVQRLVTVERGQTASLLVSMGRPSTFGWITIASPIVLQVFEEDRKLGTSETDRLMLTAGRHFIRLSNSRLGFQSLRTVQVPAGGAAPLKVDIPNGVVNLNALPWAEAFIDGRPVGETPLGNIRLPIGEHEALFRHPQLGERQQTFIVTTSEPTHVAVDLTK
jgi:hypothetical protein